MSLINDMLRDLAGHQHAGQPADDHHQLLADSGLARRQRKAWVPSALVFVIVLLVLVIAQRYFVSNTDSSPLPLEQGLQEHQEQPPPKATAEPLLEQGAHLVAHKPSTAVAEVTQVAGDSMSSTANVTGFVAEPPPANAEQVLVEASAGVDEETEPNKVVPRDVQPAIIDALLQLAMKSLAQDRLTSPIEDSAYHYYQQVLAIAPQHPQAVRGLAMIVERYLTLADEAVQVQDLVRAQTFLRRAKLVVPDYPGIVALERQVADARLLSGQQPEASRVTNAEEIPATSLEPVALVQVPPETAGESYSLPEQPVIAAQQMQVTPNRAWQDQETAARARALMQQGQLESARIALEFFLQQQPDASVSNQLLCHIYLEQGDLVAAAKLLSGANADSWPINERVRLHAQLLVAQGKTSEALALLEAHLPDAEKDERYRALLASQYHAAGNYHESVASYRRLLSVFGEKSAYWLGMALSLDALEQKASALESYRRAQSFQPLQAEVNAYIEQRIAALSR